MIVGHFIIKRYRKFKDQGIGTRFIIVGIPLIPIQSFYYLDSKRSIDIDLHWQHALKVYIIMFSAFYLIYKFATRDYYDNISIPVIFVVLLNILVYFFLDTYTPKERQIRELLSRAVFINALPKFLGEEVAYNFQKSFVATYQNNFGISWKESLKCNSYKEEHIPLLFTIMVYDMYLNDSSIAKNYFEKVFKEFKINEKIFS